MKFKIIWLIFFLILSSCRYQGTDSGNPGLVDSGNSSDQATLIRLSSYQLIDNICTKIRTCFDLVNTNSCIKNYLSMTKFAHHLKLQNQTLTGWEIVDLERSEQLKTNKEQVKNCSENITNLNCNDELIQRSYNLNQVNNFENLNELFKTSISCNELLAE